MKIKNHNALLIVILFFTGYSCLNENEQFEKEKNSTPVFETMQDKIPEEIQNNIDTAINDLETKVLMEGDPMAYSELQYSRYDAGDYNFLIWAIVMANKFDNANAQMDVFHCFVELNCINFDAEEYERRSLDNLDFETRKFALSYVKKAALNKHPQAIDYLDRFKKEGRYQKELK